jgi:hypothetical protein
MKRISSSLKEKNKSIPLNIYTGKWVVFTNGKTIAHGQNLKNLMKKVKKLKNREKTSVMLVPKKTEGNHII